MLIVELVVEVLIAVGNCLIRLDLLETTEKAENYLKTSHLSGDTYMFHVCLRSGNAHQSPFLQVQYYLLDKSSSVMLKLLYCCCCQHEGYLELYLKENVFD